MFFNLVPCLICDKKSIDGGERCTGVEGVNDATVAGTVEAVGRVCFVVVVVVVGAVSFNVVPFLICERSIFRGGGAEATKDEGAVVFSALDTGADVLVEDLDGFAGSAVDIDGIGGGESCAVVASFSV